jgi:hypothetical protein
MPHRFGWNSRTLSRRLDAYIGVVSRSLNDRADVNPLTASACVYADHP